MSKGLILTKSRMRDSLRNIFNNLRRAILWFWEGVIQCS